MINRLKRGVGPKFMRSATSIFDGLQIIERLRFMFAGQTFRSLQFKQNGIVHNQIGSEYSNRHAAKFHRYRYL